MKIPAGWLAICAVAAMQDGAADFGKERQALYESMAADAEKAAEQLVKAKAFDEARALLEVVRAKSDARKETLDKLIEKAAQGGTKDPWGKDAQAKVREFGTAQSKRFAALAKKWKGLDDQARWVETEGEILENFVEYVRSHWLVNDIRAKAGVPRVGFDWKLSVGCVWHAKYMTKYPDDKEESKDRPEYTEEGRWADKHTVSSLENSLLDLVNETIHGALSRVHALRPTLSHCGYGKLGQSSLWDVHSKVQAELTVEIVLFPPDRCEDVPIKGIRYEESIVPGMEGTSMGYPISLTFFRQGARVTNVAASLSTGGKDLDCALGTPERPLNPAKYPGNRNTILLVPKSALKSGSRYQVKLTYDLDGSSKTTEWSFQTKR